MIATGTWVILKDPREKKVESLVELLDETKDRIAEEQSDTLSHNVLEIISVGPHVRDRDLMLESGKVAVDPRTPVAMIATDKDKDEHVLVVQENQIMMVL